MASHRSLPLVAPLLIVAGCLGGPAPEASEPSPTLGAPDAVPFPASAAWRTLPAATIPRAEHCVALVGSKFYVIGGYIIANPVSAPGAAGGIPTGPPTNRVEVFDAETRAWTMGPDYPTTLDHCLAQGIEGTVYVVYRSAAGGGSYKLAPGATTWTALPDPPNAHNAGISAVIDGKLFVTGGGGEAGRALDVYDPATNQWTTKEARMPTRRDHTSGAEAGGRFYVIGGDIGGHSRNTEANEVYDPVADNWTTLAPLPVIRGSLTAVSWFGRILVMGGQNGATNVDAFRDVNAYDPATDSWLELPKMPSGRHGFGAGVYKDRVYVFSGAPQQGVSGFAQAHLLEASG